MKYRDRLLHAAIEMAVRSGVEENQVVGVPQFLKVVDEIMNEIDAVRRGEEPQRRVYRQTGQK